MNGTKKKSSPEIVLFKELLKPVHSSPLSLFLPYTNNPSSTLFVHCAIFLTYKSNPFSLLLKVIQWIPTLHTHIQKNYICRCQKNTCYVPSSSLQFRLTYTYSMLQTKNKYCISGNTNYLSLLSALAYTSPLPSESLVFSEGPVVVWILCQPNN